MSLVNISNENQMHRSCFQKPSRLSGCQLLDFFLKGLSHVSHVPHGSILAPPAFTGEFVKAPRLNLCREKRRKESPTSRPIKSMISNHLGISKNRGIYPQIIHFNRVFHYKPSILGETPPIFGSTPHFWGITIHWLPQSGH